MRLPRATLAALAISFAAHAAEPIRNVQDLWWGGPEQNGWGMSIVQHGDTLFCVLFVYDDTAHTTWYFMPSGTWNESHTTYSGKLYWPRGTPYFMYDASQLNVGEPYGEMSIEFESESVATLRYTIAGAFKQSRHIERMRFGPPQAARMQGLTDLWWGGVQENGWGVMIAQQHDSLFILWFTYIDKDAYPTSGNPTWFVMPAGQWTSANSLEGRIYRPFGCRWLGYDHCQGQVTMPDNGPFRLVFEDRDHASLHYSVLGRSGFLTLTRVPF